MKKAILVLSLTLLSINSWADDIKEYNKRLNACKTKYEKLKENSQKELFKTLSMTQVNLSLRDLSNKQIDCYGEVAYDFIDVYYTKNRESLRYDLEQYLKNTYIVNEMMYNSLDRCEDMTNCGLEGTFTFPVITSRNFYFMVFELINGMDLVNQEFKNNKEQQ